MNPLPLHTVPCVVCGAAFQTTQPVHAKYCSEACRRQGRREKDRLRYPLHPRKAYGPRKPRAVPVEAGEAEIEEEPQKARGPRFAAQTTTCLACHSIGERQSACRRCGGWLA